MPRLSSKNIPSSRRTNNLVYCLKSMSRPWRPSCPSFIATRCVYYPCLLSSCNLLLSVRSQMAAQQHQVTLTEHYDLSAREPSPPSESAANPAVNASLHRLSQVLQATLLSIAGHDPSEILERTNTNVEAGGSYQPPGTRPASEQREQRPSDAPRLQLQSGLADSPESNTATSHSVQVESETQ